MSAALFLHGCDAEFFCDGVELSLENQIIAGLVEAAVLGVLGILQIADTVKRCLFGR